MSPHLEFSKQHIWRQWMCINSPALPHPGVCVWFLVISVLSHLKMMPNFDAVFTCLVYAFDTKTRRTILKHLESNNLSTSQQQVLNDYLSNVKGRKFDYNYSPELLTEEQVKETYELFVNSKYFDESQLYGLQLLYWLQHAENDMTSESLASWIGRVKETIQEKVMELHKPTKVETKFKPSWYFFVLQYLRDFKPAKTFCTIVELEGLITCCLGATKELPVAVRHYWEQQIKDEKLKKLENMAPEDNDIHLYKI